MASYITSSNLTSSLSSYAPLSGPTFSGTLAAPIINASSTLQYGGVDTTTIYQPKSWVCCSVSYGSSSASIATNNSKAASVGVSWNTTGVYNITFSPTPGSVLPTAVLCSIRNAQGTINYSGLAYTGVTIFTTNLTGSGANYIVSLMAVL